MKKVKVIAVIGKAGSGKNTFVNRYMNTPDTFKYEGDDQEYLAIYRKIKDSFEEKIHLIVPFTTRPMRPGEVEGRDYHFYKEGSVDDLICSGEIAQATYFREWLYGFAWDEFIEDKLNIGIFNPGAVIDLLDYDGLDITTIYIDAPDKDRLLRQLNREDNPDVKEIVRRFGTDDYDFREEVLAEIPNLIRINNPNITKKFWEQGYGDQLFGPYEEFLKVINSKLSKEMGIND